MAAYGENLMAAVKHRRPGDAEDVGRDAVEGARAIAYHAAAAPAAPELSRSDSPARRINQEQKRHRSPPSRSLLAHRRSADRPLCGAMSYSMSPVRPTVQVIGRRLDPGDYALRNFLASPEASDVAGSPSDTGSSCWD